MPSALTLHTLDPHLSECLSAYARRQKKSLNQSAKELLSSALGIDAPRPTDHSADLERFAGAWNDETAEALRAHIGSFETIDEARWQ